MIKMIDKIFCEICGKELKEYVEFEICEVCKSKGNLIKNYKRLKEINETLLEINKEREKIIKEIELAKQ